MAKIPIAEFNQGIQGQVSTVDASIVSRGEAGAALAGFGNALGNISETLLKKRYDAATNDYVHSNLVQASIGVNDFAKQDKLQNPNGEGHQERVAEYVLKFKDEALKNAPNEDAEQILNNHLGQIYERSYIDADSWANKTKADLQTLNIIKNNQALSSSQASSPSINAMPEQLALIDASWEDAKKLNVDAATAEKHRISAKDDLTENFFDGLANNKQYKSALQMLKDPNDKIASNLLADKRSSLITKINAKVEQESLVKLSEINELENNVISSAVNDGIVNKELVNKLYYEIQTNPHLSPNQRLYKTDQLKIYLTVGTEIGKLHNLPSGQLIKAELPELGKQVEVAEARNKMKRAFEVAKENILRDRQQDPALYITNRDSELRNLTAQSNNFTNPQASQELLNLRSSKLEAMGMPQFLLTKSESNQMEKSITNAPNSEAASIYLKTYMTSLGKYSQGALTQAFHGKDNQGLMMMAYMQDDLSRARIFEDFKPDRKKAIMESFKDQSNPSKQIFKLELANTMTPIVKALASSSGDGSQIGLSQALEESVSLEAQKIMGSSPHGVSEKEAIDQAFNRLISPNFILAQGGTTSTIVPIKSGEFRNNQNQMNRFLEYYSDQNIGGLKELDVAIPKSFSIKEPQAFYESMSKYMRWTLSDSKAGLKLVIDHPKDGFIEVKDSKGHPIQKSFEEINNSDFSSTKMAKKQVTASSGRFDPYGVNR